MKNGELQRNIMSQILSIMYKCLYAGPRKKKKSCENMNISVGPEQKDKGSLKHDKLFKNCDVNSFHLSALPVGVRDSVKNH